MADILVTDDQADVRALVRQALERAGHAVAEAVDGEDALEQIKTKRFDLVITDMSMPEVDGIELTRLLRLQESPPKIIGITGDDSVNLEIVSLLGARGTLTKPFTPSQLLALVDEVLRGPPD